MSKGMRDYMTKQALDQGRKQHLEDLKLTPDQQLRAELLTYLSRLPLPKLAQIVEQHKRLAPKTGETNGSADDS